MLKNLITDYIYRVHYVTRSPHGNSEVKEIADDNENKHSTPKKRNLTPNSSTSVFGKSVNKSGNTEIEHGDKNVNGALEISFHIKEAWNIFEVRTCICNGTNLLQLVIFYHTFLYFISYQAHFSIRTRFQVIFIL